MEIQCNSTTGTKEKSSIMERIRIMEGVAESLVNAGVEIINLQVSQPGNFTYVLLHNCGDEFRQWAEENELDVSVTPLEPDDPDSGIHWRVGVIVNGIDVHGYFRDYEKEAWDNAAV